MEATGERVERGEERGSEARAEASGGTGGARAMGSTPQTPQAGAAPGSGIQGMESAEVSELFSQQLPRAAPTGGPTVTHQPERASDTRAQTLGGSSNARRRPSSLETPYTNLVGAFRPSHAHNIHVEQPDLFETPLQSRALTRDSSLMSSPLSQARTSHLAKHIPSFTPNFIGSSVDLKSATNIIKQIQAAIASRRNLIHDRIQIIFVIALAEEIAERLCSNRATFQHVMRDIMGSLTENLPLKQQLEMSQDPARDALANLAETNATLLQANLAQLLSTPRAKSESLSQYVTRLIDAVGVIAKIARRMSLDMESHLNPSVVMALLEESLDPSECSLYVMARDKSETLHDLFLELQRQATMHRRSLSLAPPSATSVPELRVAAVQASGPQAPVQAEPESRGAQEEMLEWMERTSKSLEQLGQHIAVLDAKRKDGREHEQHESQKRPRWHHKQHTQQVRPSYPQQLVRPEYQGFMHGSFGPYLHQPPPVHYPAYPQVQMAPPVQHYLPAYRPVQHQQVQPQRHSPTHPSRLTGANGVPLGMQSRLQRPPHQGHGPQ